MVNSLAFQQYIIHFPTIFRNLSNHCDANLFVEEPKTNKYIPVCECLYISSRYFLFRYMCTFSTSARAICSWQFIHLNTMVQYINCAYVRDINI